VGPCQGQSCCKDMWLSPRSHEAENTRIGPCPIQCNPPAPPQRSCADHDQSGEHIGPQQRPRAERATITMCTLILGWGHSSLCSPIHSVCKRCLHIVRGEWLERVRLCIGSGQLPFEFSLHVTRGHENHWHTITSEVFADYRFRA